jgi:hypothetical protein
MHSQKVDFAQSRSQNTFCEFVKICLGFLFGQQPWILHHRGQPQYDPKATNQWG